MSSVRFAGRYAKSLLEIAKEKGTLDAVNKDVDFIYATLQSSRELRVSLNSPVVPSDKKASILNQIFSGKIQEITSMFLTLLANKGRGGYLVDICSAFKTQYNTLNQITKVTLVTANELDHATRDSIIDGLKAKEKLKSVELTQSVDASLLGGFILTYAGKQIDTSVKTSMNKLQTLVEDDSYVKKYS